MNTIFIRRVLFTLATAAGMISASAGAASAGLLLSNHCETLHHNR